MKQQKAVKPVILYFGNDWFAENRTSSHHIARWLAERYSVYYLECPGLRAPTSSGRDVKKIFRKLWQFFQGARPVPEGLKVRTLLQVPLHRFALVRGINRLLTRMTIRWLMIRERLQDPIAWFVIPHLPFLVGKLNTKLSVYYCIDDYAALPHVNASIVRAMDEETTRKADLVFIASETLLPAKSRLNSRTFVSPHGVDCHHFARAQDPRLATPADTAALPGPVIGFFGLIESWIDLRLIDYLAEQRPGWSFLCIGRVAVPDEELPKRPNVHFIGPRPYDTLPAYGKQFDAAIIPYRMTRQVYHANPIKLREYLAMGKPIVSVSTPEIDKFADVVAIARSREAFLARLDEALANPLSREEVERRQNRVASSSWDARLRRVIDIVRNERSCQNVMLLEADRSFTHSPASTGDSTDGEYCLSASGGPQSTVSRSS